MSVPAYLAAWLRRATSGTAGIVSTIATFAGAAAVAFATLPNVPQWITDLRWQTIAVTLLVAPGRLVLAPYWMHRDIERQLDQLRQQNQILGARRVKLEPRFTKA